MSLRRSLIMFRELDGDGWVGGGEREGKDRGEGGVLFESMGEGGYCC
jgi:hypothetical protein